MWWITYLRDKIFAHKNLRNPYKFSSSNHLGTAVVTNEYVNCLEVEHEQASICEVFKIPFLMTFWWTMDWKTSLYGNHLIWQSSMHLTAFVNPLISCYHCLAFFCQCCLDEALCLFPYLELLFQRFCPSVVEGMLNDISQVTMLNCWDFQCILPSPCQLHYTIEMWMTTPSLCHI